MKETLSSWVSAADASMHLTDMRVTQGTLEVDHVIARFDDYYISLVAELFRKMRNLDEPGDSWALLANALRQATRIARRNPRWDSEFNADEALIFSAAAFYAGGFPAAAYLVARDIKAGRIDSALQASLDLLLRRRPQSEFVGKLFSAVVNDELERIQAATNDLEVNLRKSIERGPTSFVAERLLLTLTLRFAKSNIRAVLGNQPGNWKLLIDSFVGRIDPTWEFFPSQIQAIEKGVLADPRSFSLQMPTGSGKTTLCETILYAHLKANPTDAALLLVPFRSLASELRASVVANLNQMDIAARSAYGGSVPSGNEVHALEAVRAVVGTPESVSGLLSADARFAKRISLVICDEGHLLDGGQRGIALELLLARLRARAGGAPRIIFISAIVPNIKEINAWLGGTDETVVVSSYRPSIAEFSMMIAEGTGANQEIYLRLHPHLDAPEAFDIRKFLTKEDFRYYNVETDRTRTYGFNSYKTKAIAAARKTLPMGLVAVFAANKKGTQGVIGLGEELLAQLEVPLSLPSPGEFVDQDLLAGAVEYFNKEFGGTWIGSRCLSAGAAIHHGDLPQECRELVEHLLRASALQLVICTSTLAEGVNLPIRTLVLYSVQRLEAGGTRTSLLARDIKNLVGRAGRAGSTTKGLVICVNDGQWAEIEPVATQGQMEPVTGALRTFLEALRARLFLEDLPLTQALLEAADADSETLALVDGVDAVLVELAAEELGEKSLKEVAAAVAEASFAATGVDGGAKQLLKDVFSLRAVRIEDLKATGRIEWIRTRGAKARFISSVEEGLLPLRDDWATVGDAKVGPLLDTLLDWAWTHYDVRVSTCETFGLDIKNEEAVAAARGQLTLLVRFWIAGAGYPEIALLMKENVDLILTAVARALSYSLVSVLEQGIAILDNLVEGGVSQSVETLLERVRYGVPNESAVLLIQRGVRNRSVAIALSQAPEVLAAADDFARRPVSAAAQVLRDRHEDWRQTLGQVMYENAIADLPLSP